MEEQRAGIYMGINIKNAIPIAFNIFDEKYFQKDKSNNWLKLHGKVMRRKPFKRETQGNVIILGQTGYGKSFHSKLQKVSMND